MLRLNAATVLFSSVMAATLPSRAKHETQPKLETAGILKSVAIDPATVPAFVPLVNFSSFLLAVEDNQPVSPAARLAAEELSMKFSGGSAGESASSSPNALGEAVTVVASASPEEIPELKLQTTPASEVEAVDVTRSYIRESAHEGRRARKASRQSRTHHHARRLRLDTQSAEGHRRRVVATRTAKASSGGIASDLQTILGFVGMAPDQRLTN